MNRRICSYKKELNEEKHTKNKANLDAGSLIKHSGHMNLMEGCPQRPKRKQFTP